uniref:Protein YIPF n=1 Tax=Ditylenchus dipsaci TaxID=166011 RepID=A0A915EFK3_9BILA
MSYLQFQDFNTPNEESSNSPFTDPTFEKGHKKPISSQISTGNLGSEATTTDSKKAHFLSFQFYQQYFDVDTTQVQTRILNSMFPKRNSNFLSDFIQPSPDLYGPFWICVTLIFSTAICGNFVRYAQKEPTSTYESDFSLVTGSTSLITSYVIIVPFAIYSLLWYRKSLIQYSYMELLCAYGYSLSIFIPVSVNFMVIQIHWFRWLIIISAVMLSGTVLANSLWPTIKGDTNRLVSFFFIAGVLLMHALLAICFKEFFFDTSMPTQRSPAIIQSEQQLMAQLTTLKPILEESKNKSNANAQEQALPVAASQIAGNGTEQLQKAAKKEIKETKNVNASSSVGTTSGIPPSGNAIYQSSTIPTSTNTEDSKKSETDSKSVSKSVDPKQTNNAKS